MKYEIIFNPNRPFLKHEVWYAGEAAVQDSNGYMCKKNVVTCTRWFSTADRAKGYIDYQLAVQRFKQVAGVEE